MITVQIVAVIAVLAVAGILFITEWLSMDLVALLVLGVLAVSGLVTPAEALAGFSNPAVITVWAIFILSGGLARTGLANRLGQRLLRLAGSSEIRLVIMIMLSAGLLSAVMNNVGVAALFLPVVMDMARHARISPSKLLMPLSYATLLGGLLTLIGTPPNILVSDLLRSGGLTPFQMFDFTPLGLSALLAGTAYMALLGRRLLPDLDLTRNSSIATPTDLRRSYDLDERMLMLRLPPDSPLAGKTLAQSRIGSVLGLNVIDVLRDDRDRLAPEPSAVLRSGDRLLVEGRRDALDELRRGHPLLVEDERVDPARLSSSEVQIVELNIPPGSSLVGQTLLQADLRRKQELNVLAILHGGEPQRAKLHDTPLQAGDRLLVQTTRQRLVELQSLPDFEQEKPAGEETLARKYGWREGLLALHLPQESTLVGRTLAESRLGDAFDLTVLGVVRGSLTILLPSPEERLQAGDTLLVQGDPEELRVLRGLQNLEFEREPAGRLPDLESARVGLAEIVLSPHASSAGKTLRQLHFREKYGLSVLAIWREGRPYRSNLRSMPLRFGDAMLLYGPRERLNVLGSETDFIVLTQAAQEAPRGRKAPLAALIMAAVLVPAILGWLPIAISAVLGAALMVLTRCLTMDEAYRSIDWRAVFLIAGMLPLGIAMEKTGAATILAGGVIAAAGQLGPLAAIGAVFLVATVATQVIPSAALVLLMGPIALSAAGSLGISAPALMMTLAVAASANFITPISHPANILVMGPGGYRFRDYLRSGLPLTLLLLIVVLLLVPVLWPLSG